MNYLRSGRIVPGFENEEVISCDTQDEIDVEQLSADLEAQQAVILEESNNLNAAIESAEELENTISEIEVAMESDIDLVSAQLLINSLHKHSNVLYGKKLKSAGLQSNNPKSVLQAGLEDAKGMLNGVKEFIAKVWQKIKDAFAWVWKKMKDFWIWLTSAGKKTDEKTDEAIASVAAVNAAVDKADDIKKATEDVKAKRDPDEMLKAFRKRQNLTKAMNAGKLDTDPKSDNFLKVKDGKFKGKDIGSLSKAEFNEWMSESKANEEIVIDVVVEDIIVTEVAKKTGADEEEIFKALPVGSMKNMAVFAYNPKNTDRIIKIINDNISEKIKKAEWKEDIDATLLNIAFMQTAIFGATSGNGMAINKLRPVNLFSDFREWLDENKKTIDNKINGYVLGKDSFASPDNVGRSNALMTSLLKNFVYRDVKSGITPIEDICAHYTMSLKQSTENIINISNNLRNILTNFDSGNENLETINVLGFGKADQLNLFLPLDYNSKTNTGTFFTAVGSYEVNFYNNKISDTLEFTKTDLERFGGMNFIGSDVSKTKGSYISNIGKANMLRVEESINHMIKFMDDALKETSSSNIDPNGFSTMTNYKKIQSNLVTMANRSSLLSIKSIRDLCYTYSVYGTKINNLLDIPGAIAQAAKELGK